MINMTTFFSSQSIGGTVYIPYTDVAIIIHNNDIVANLESPELTLETSENILEADMQEDIFHATLYSVKEATLEC